MNKHPYSDFDQAIHLLFMPIVHKELPNDFSRPELINQVDAVHAISQKLDHTAYLQEWFTNWGRLGGQTVAHWHSQLKIFTQPPCSMPERMKRVKNFSITTIEGAFEKTKELLKACPVPSPDVKEMHSYKECLCCMIRNGQENNADNNDKDNFIVARFLHNYICLSHYPSYAGEICVVPHRHVAAIKDLSQDELRENMILAMALFPKMKEYAQMNIRECDGGNLYTKSIGSKASREQQEAYHVCTVIMPRTTISPTPGTKSRNSCKLDYDPNHLYQYLKDEVKNIII
jgi:diadenosine tetraphosphate (Ap4A) HIT family hydrolase